MPGETLAGTALRIKVKDVFSMKDMVKTLVEWFKDHDYFDMEGSQDENGQETLYSHKVMNNGTYLDLWMLWRLAKYPGAHPRGTKPKNPYVRYLFQLDFHYLGDNNEVEVQHKGKKVKLNKGEMEVDIRSTIEIDPDNQWDKQGIAKVFKDVFRKRVYRKEMDDHVSDVLIETFKLHSVLKQFFNLPTVMPPETLSQPPKGLI